jgi:hypothetical protein
MASRLPDRHIQELCAQLFRAENHAVIETVAELLHLAIEKYVSNATQPAGGERSQPIVEKTSPPT